MALFAQFSNIIDPSQKEKSNEWYTPAPYGDAARSVMNGIDLDPASCEEANRIIKANRYYTKEQNGLVQDWHCSSMWLNPPYGLNVPKGVGTGTGRFKGSASVKTSLQRLFIEKLLFEYRAHRVKQAILLVTANTTVGWFQPLWDYPFCTPFPKISFLRPGQAPTERQIFGNVLVYLGPHEQRFIDVFSQFGRIAKAIDTPKPKITPLSLWEEM